MELISYEQFTLSADFIGAQSNYLMPDAEVEVQFWNGNPIGLELPLKMVFAVVETVDEVSKGNSSGGITKDAKLETGLVIQVPSFIKTGTKVAGQHRDRRLHRAGLRPHPQYEPPRRQDTKSYNFKVICRSQALCGRDPKLTSHTMSSRNHEILQIFALPGVLVVRVYEGSSEKGAGGFGLAIFRQPCIIGLPCYEQKANISLIPRRG